MSLGFLSSAQEFKRCKFPVYVYVGLEAMNKVTYLQVFVEWYVVVWECGGQSLERHEGFLMEQLMYFESGSIWV